VIPGREFGDHASVRPVHGHLTVEPVRQQSLLLVVNRDRRLIAGTLNADYPHKLLEKPPLPAKNVSSPPIASADAEPLPF